MFVIIEDGLIFLREVRHVKRRLAERIYYRHLLVNISEEPNISEYI